MDLVVWLLPLVFMFHDFEEIIFMRWWVDKNRDFMSHKYPSIAKRILPVADKLSTAGFAIAVFEEFVILTSVTIVAIVTGWYYLWLALFMAFTIHIVVHILQWVVVRKYIPTIVTSLLVLPYCIWGLIKISECFSFSEVLIWSLFGVLIMILNLIFAHWISLKIQQRLGL